MTQYGEIDVSSVMRGLDLLDAEVRRRAVRALRSAGEYLLGEAVAIVPLDTGALSNSGKVTVDAQKLTVTVSFDTPYAEQQHEDLTLHHPGGREAKYLEGPLTRGRADIIKVIEREMGLR